MTHQQPDDKNEQEASSEEDFVLEEDEESRVREGQDAASKLKKTKEELKKCQQERMEYLEGWQRAKADYVNFKKETEANRAEVVSLVKFSLLADFLPALDSFEMAFGNQEAWQQAPENWRKGVEYIYNQLLNILKDNGVTPIEEKGIPFNPAIHESVASIDTPTAEEDNMVLEIVKKGYKFNDKILRPASVKVGHYQQ